MSKKKGLSLNEKLEQMMESLSSQIKEYHDARKDAKELFSELKDLIGE